MIDFESSKIDILNEGKTFVQFYPKIPDSIAIPMPGSEIFKQMWDERPVDKSIIKMLGKEVLTPRYQQTYGKDYHFAGVDNKSKPLESFPNDYLNKLLIWSNDHMKRNKLYIDESKKDYDLNGIVVNWYDEGHYIGPHSDKERDLVLDMPIYSFSFGFSRDFDIYPVGKPKLFKTRVLLNHNSLIIMGGTCQKTHKHAVPKRKRCGKRINITLRCFK